jgi:outer membrane protein
MIRRLIIPFFLLCSPVLLAQEMYTVDKILEYAFDNSPTLRKSEISMLRSKENLKAAEAKLKSNFSLNVSPLDYSTRQVFETATSSWNSREVLRSSGTFSIVQPILLTGGELSLRNNFYYQDFYQEFMNDNNTRQNTADDFPDNSTDRSFNNALSLNFSQPIFTHNRLKMDLSELQNSFENTSISYELQRLNIEKQVKQLFYNVYQNQISLEIAKEELRNNQSSYDIIKNKVDGGLVALEELYQAEVNLASSRSALYTREVQLENSLDRLKILIGMSINEKIMVITDIAGTKTEVDLPDAINRALENRMEIRQREIDIEESQFEIIRSRATNEFAGTIDASFGLSGYDPAFLKVMSKPETTPSVKVTFNVPLFDWGERKARIKAAELNRENAEIDLDEEKKDIIMNIRSVYRNLKNLENQIDIQRINVKNAQLTFEINSERYKNGDLTGMELSQYQNQLSNRKMALTSALIDYKLELLNLKIQTLYDFESGESIVPTEAKKK